MIFTTGTSLLLQWLLPQFSRNMAASLMKYPIANRKVLIYFLNTCFARILVKYIKTSYRVQNENSNSNRGKQRNWFEICRSWIFWNGRSFSVQEISEKDKSRQVLGKNVIVRQLDVTNEASIQNLYRFISKELGGIDVLINNAGLGVHAQENKLHQV